MYELLYQQLKVELRQLSPVEAFSISREFINLKLPIARGPARGRGYATKLFSKFTAKFKATDKPIYSVARNPAAIKMVVKAGFVKVLAHRLTAASSPHAF